MLPGAFSASKKDGSIYYRSSITYRNKHISLGSFPTEEEAAQAYLDAKRVLNNTNITLSNLPLRSLHLSFERLVILLNFRDNKIYFKTPIYLYHTYFDYYLSHTQCLKFDIDDLFYYSSHRILKRQGHLYVNDYGMQYSILARYGIKNYSIVGKDYIFANGDPFDFRYSNIIVINKYYGVTKHVIQGRTLYQVKIHINGSCKVGIYSNEVHAAVAYNKAVDLARTYGIAKNFLENYIVELSAREYAEIYTTLHISKRFRHYLRDHFSKVQDV